MKKALITGIAGQDGSFLTELLLEKDYQVAGLVLEKENLENILSVRKKVKLYKGNLQDKKSLKRIITAVKPNEIYNLAAISFTPLSWQKPSLVADVNGLGVARLLEIIRDQVPKTRFFQASSVEIFKPLNPYAASKAFAHFLIQSFRAKYNLHASSAIFYNHESERRPPEFVTRKIIQGAVKIKLGLLKKLELGNLESKRDWGYAKDYVRAAWLMLQQNTPSDYVIATGKLHSVKDICKIAFKTVGLSWQDYVVVKREFFRKEKPQEKSGDASRAKKILGWKPTVSFKKMIEKMVLYDLEMLSKR